MRTTIFSALVAASLALPGWTATVSAVSLPRLEPSQQCAPVAQLPIGLAASQTMRLNVTCLASLEHAVASCPVTLRFVDDAGLPVVVSSVPLELKTEVPVRGLASLDLPGAAFVPPALRRVVRAVVLFDLADFSSDRLAMNVEVFDTVTGRAEIRYAFEPCRTLPFAFLPGAQRPDSFTGVVRELSFAPPGITVDEDVNLNVICNPDADAPQAPCHVVLRYSGFETAKDEPVPASPIAERELAIPPGAIGSFSFPGDMLGATPGSRAMFRPSVVGTPTTLGRLVTSFEIVEQATGIAHSLYQPPNKQRSTFLLLR